MKKIFKHIFSLLGSCTFLLASCQLHEEPEMTATGEWGVDPTEVTVKAQLSLRLTVSDAASKAFSTRAEGDAAYLHRFIVDAYLSDATSVRQVVYEEVVDGRTLLTVPVSLKLHARPYRLAVWADYVQADQRADWFYDTTTLTPVIGNGRYQGNTDWKDAFYAMQEVDLSSYRNDWNVQVPLELTLSRPVARYRLLATDLDKLMDKVSAGEVSGNKFTVRVKYSDYLPMGFDVLTGQLRNSLLYMSYSKEFTLPETPVKDFEIGFDYVLCNETDTAVPVEVEVVDSQSKTVARSIIRLRCIPGMLTTVRDNFLTADPALAEDGVGIDPDFDDEIDMEVEVI